MNANIQGSELISLGVAHAQHVTQTVPSACMPYLCIAYFPWLALYLWPKLCWFLLAFFPRTSFTCLFIFVMVFDDTFDDKGPNGNQVSYRNGFFWSTYRGHLLYLCSLVIKRGRLKCKLVCNFAKVNAKITNAIYLHLLTFCTIGLGVSQSQFF